MSEPVREAEGFADVVATVASTGVDKVFLSYQASAIALSHEHELLVIEKSRRIGITWAFAGDDAISAASTKVEGGDDVLYISFNHDMTREYVDAVAGFAKAFMGIDAEVGEFLFEDEDPKAPGETRQIKAFRIDFASGHHVQALSSAPRSLRSKQGKVRIDEAAFVDDLEELLKSAMALTIWGSKVAVMSTHNGVDHPFNQLVQRIRSGEQLGHVLRITFDDAVQAGLYERVCLRTGETPTPEGRVAWVTKIRGLYGAGASEELDVIPARGGGAWLSFDEVERAERAGVPVLRWELDDAFGRWSDRARELAARLWFEENVAPAIRDRVDQRAPHGLGGDFARRVDLSVLWLFEERPDRDWITPFTIEMRNVPITEQQLILRLLLDALRRWAAKLDAGGLGLAIAERAQQIFGAERVDLVNMRSEFWLTEAPPLKSRFQDGRVQTPRDRDTSSDLRGIQVKGGVPFIPDQRTRAKGEDAKKGATRHFDAGVAMILASAALRSGAIGPFDGIVAGERAGSWGGGDSTIRDGVGFGVGGGIYDGPRGW